MRNFVLFLLVCVFQMGIGQTKKKDQPMVIVTHEVQLGETVRMLSKKYLTDPTEIYRINKFAVDGITEGMVLKIPIPRKEENVSSQAVAENSVKDEVPAPVESKSNVAVIDRSVQTDHVVVSGETLSGLSRKYGISIDEIKMSNADLLKKGLKIGQTLKIPSTRILDEDEASIGSDVTPTTEVSPKAVAKSDKSSKNKQ